MRSYKNPKYVIFEFYMNTEFEFGLQKIEVKYSFEGIIPSRKRTTSSAYALY